MELYALIYQIIIIGIPVAVAVYVFLKKRKKLADQEKNVLYYWRLLFPTAVAFIVSLILMYFCYYTALFFFLNSKLG